jgi:hypothetical protein
MASLTPPPEHTDDMPSASARLPLTVNVGTLIALVGLIVALGVAQWLVIPQLDKAAKAADGKPAAAAKAEASAEAQPAKPVFQLPAPVGPADAKVKIVAFVATSNGCHENTTLTLSDIAKAYKGKVRLEFVDMSGKEGRKEADAMGIACDSGLMINGRTEWTLGTGPKAQKVRFFGPVDEHEYGVAQLCSTIDYLLKHPELKAPATTTGAKAAPAAAGAHPAGPQPGHS